MICDSHKEAIHLLNLAVDPSYRLRGVGRQMIQRIADKLLPEGPRSVELVIDERNLEAQKFFRSCGFLAEGIEPGFSDDGRYDGFRMRLKHLTPDAKDVEWQRRIDREERESSRMRGRSGDVPSWEALQPA
jgi:ribosomal protein S18 acetylase RimI-like enzyme